MAKDPKEYKFIVICCELYQASCIDWLYRIEEHHLQRNPKKSKPRLLWLDTQYNEIMHAKFNADTAERYDSLGILYKEGRNIRYA